MKAGVASVFNFSCLEALHLFLYSQAFHIILLTSISWIFEPATSSALKYQLEIRNSMGLLLYNQSLSGTQMVYTIPDPCDRYDAAVTAIYGYPNLTCTQRGFVQLVGGEDRYCLYFMAYERHHYMCV